ncbi:MAG: prenyltransferase [Candidatus Omnitrophica bacterium]|nr:prenyltransferase [Candidatus Omnitrophota bacterium]
MSEEPLAAKERILRPPFYLVRALRLPFVSASLLPFLLGSLINKDVFHFSIFFLGLTSAISTHLSANLLNDYADSKSGVDWQERQFYGFFGGSKLIQQGIFSERFYLLLGGLFLAISAGCIFILTFLLKDLRVAGYYSIIIFLGIAYSHKPLQLAYRYLGELVIFLLFGPALVMGGYFLQTGIFPDIKSLLVSLPMGLLVSGILFANEIPDYPQDKKCGKNNLVSLLGPKRSYLIYLLINFAAFFTIALNINRGYFSRWAYLSFLFIPLVLRAGFILRETQEKIRLVESSKIAIATHIFVSILLIADLLL